MEGDVITMQDIFAFEVRTSAERVRSELRPTGIRPAFTERLASRGIELPPSWFGYEELPREVRA
jgi:pilus assembly protein CpaF